MNRGNRVRSILVWAALGAGLVRAPARAGTFRVLAPSEEAAFGTVPLEDLRPAALGLFALPPASASPAPAPDALALPGSGRLCVLFQCRALPVAPAPKLFTRPVAIWTAAALLGGFADGIEGPANYGFGHFHFTDEGFFQTWTYGGGADKASHFVISATLSGILYDAYRLNGLSEDQSFGLALAATVVAGALVEIGDGLTPYGFSAQDLTADTLGGLTEAVLKRTGTDDLFGFRIGKVPTTIPPAVLGDRTETLGLDYTNEIYTADLKFDGLFARAGTPPGIARFFLSSFVFMTKGYGYDPPIPSRYQEVGFEVGLNFPEILKAVGVSRSTWWGDILLRAFEFLRIPYTQIGAYYNLTNRKWYGPGAPYHYY